MLRNYGNITYERGDMQPTSRSAKRRFQCQCRRCSPGWRRPSKAPINTPLMGSRQVADGDVEFVKIPRAINLADALTHHWTYAEALSHFPEMSGRRCGLHKTLQSSVQAKEGSSRTTQKVRSANRENDAQAYYFVHI